MEDKLGRPKTQGKCKIKGCGKDAESRNRCGTHYKQWNRKYGHLRCHWPDCHAHQDDGGRRMNGVFYCRLHENEHLRITAEAETLNLARLGHGLTFNDEGCWLWGGSRNDGGYGNFVPEGANTAKWLTHRVAWGLLIGGHKPGLELDHRTCKRPNCVNPLHLEPVTRSVNQKRKRKGPERGWSNPNAVKNPRVIEFAEHHGLPLPPVVAAAATAHIGKRPQIRRAFVNNQKDQQCLDQQLLKSPAQKSLTSATLATAASDSVAAARRRPRTATRTDLAQSTPHAPCAQPSLPTSQQTSRVYGEATAGDWDGHFLLA